MAAKKTGEDDVRLIERALKAGLGIISLGEEKLGKLADELAKRGEEYALKEESPVSRFVSALSETGETIKGTGDAIRDKGAELGKAIKDGSVGLRAKIEEEAKDVFRKFNFATKSDLEKLRADVEKLKKKVGKKKPAKKRKPAKKKI